MDTFSLLVEGKTSRGKTFIGKLEHMKRLGYWDDSIRFMADYFSDAIIKIIAFAVHPTEDRFLSERGLLHLVGMPHDFELHNPK